MQTVKKVQESINKNLVIGGIFFTMYDSRTRLAQDVVMQVKSYFKDVVFNTIIPRNVRLSEAPSHGDEYSVLNLTGCTLDSVLYFVNQGNPVIAKASETSNVVIVGYNTLNTILYYPSTGEQKYFGMQDSTEMFARWGNVFIGYMDNMGSPSKVE